MCFIRIIWRFFLFFTSTFLTFRLRSKIITLLAHIVWSDWLIFFPSRSSFPWLFFTFHSLFILFPKFFNLHFWIFFFLFIGKFFSFLRTTLLFSHHLLHFFHHNLLFFNRFFFLLLRKTWKSFFYSSSFLDFSHPLL